MSTRRSALTSAAVLLLLAACSSTSSTPAASSGGGKAASSVTVGAVLEPTSLDVLTVAGAALDQALLDNVYETLLKHTADGKIVDGLAGVPTVSADGLTYTFTLKDGVTFSDGKALTADDVVWSLRQVTAPGSKSPKAASFGSVASVTAKDAKTVVITLKSRDTDLTFSLTQRGGAVLESGASGLADKAVGTGPFVLEAWKRGSALSFTRNEKYWGAKPAIKSLTFRYFTDANAAANALTTGDVQILTGIDSAVVGSLKDDPDLTVQQGTTDGEITLGFQNTRPYLKDARVRRAIRQAIDHKGLLAVFNGYGTLIGGPVPPTDPWYEDLTASAPYDPAAARKLLAEAGATNVTLKLVVPNIYYATQGAQYVASQLKAVGITATISTVEFPTWLKQVYTDADYDLTIVDHVESHDLANYANPKYYWRYDSPAVQKLIADAKTAPTAEQATALLEQATRQIAQDSPADWLLLGADITASRKNVTGYPTVNTASRFDAARITVS